MLTKTILFEGWPRIMVARGNFKACGAVSFGLCWIFAVSSKLLSSSIVLPSPVSLICWVCRFVVCFVNFSRFLVFFAAIRISKIRK